jgi:toxin YoeB
MKLIFSDQAWEQYLYWQAQNPAVLKRINELVRDCLRSPFSGLGKPEPLAGPLSGWWSRRISQEHRLVYRVRGSGADQALEIAACRYHYRTL